MSDQSPTSQNPHDAIPGYPPAPEPPMYQQPAWEPGVTEPSSFPPATPPLASGYQPPATGYSAPPNAYAVPPVGDPYAPPSAPGPWDRTPGAYPPPPAPGTALGYPSAQGPGGTTLVEWPTRALGALIDYVAPAVITYVIAMVLERSVSVLLGSLVQYLLWAAWWTYLGYLSGTYGITPGRAVAKTKLISAETGQVIGVGAGIGRQAAHILDLLVCFLGWLFPLWDAQKQTFADKIVKTVVVDNSADPSAGQIRWS